MEALNSSQRFTTIDDLKKSLSEELEIQIGGFGFVEPGHSLKGREHWLLRDKNLQDMYSMYKKRHDITLWCFRRATEQLGTNICAMISLCHHIIAIQGHYIPSAGMADSRLGMLSSWWIRTLWWAWTTGRQKLCWSRPSRSSSWWWQ